MKYTRDELEALRSAPSSEEQALRWAEVHAALIDAGFSAEYEGLVAADEPTSRRVRNRGGWRRSEMEAGKLSEATEMGSWRNEGLANRGAVEEPFDQSGSVEYEDDSDDDEYDGILKPAFAVDGEPDFESGEPLDGFEYLRRVRWEANQIPRVKVAEIDTSTSTNNQTPYMPEIPDIPKCSSDLCASKEWEETFITYFSEKRLAFSELDSSEFDSSDGSSLSGGSKDLYEPVSSSSEPTLRMIRNMDAVSRAASLRNYIDMIQSMDTLSRNNCLWLFALCIAVEVPLDAGTCASLRSLLRKCSIILSTKLEMDDEVGMLNILIVISGRFFGQYEK